MKFRFLKFLRTDRLTTRRGTEMEVAEVDCPFEYPNGDPCRSRETFWVDRIANRMGHRRRTLFCAVCGRLSRARDVEAK